MYRYSLYPDIINMRSPKPSLSVLAHCKRSKTEAMQGRTGEGEYKKARALLLPQLMYSLVRNGSNLPIKTNITLLESFKSGRHGNTFSLTQSTWQTEEKRSSMTFICQIWVSKLSHNILAKYKCSNHCINING